MVLYANYLNAVVNIRNISEKGNTNYFILFECSNVFFFNVFLYYLKIYNILYKTSIPIQGVPFNLSTGKYFTKSD